MSLPKNLEIEVPVDFRFAKGLHEKQLEYTTRVHITVVTLSQNEEEEKYAQRLEPRYLTYNETGNYFEVMDFQTREQVYPYGFSTPEGQKRVQALLSMDEHPPEGIGPGIALFVPANEEK